MSFRTAFFFVCDGCGEEHEVDGELADTPAGWWAIFKSDGDGFGDGNFEFCRSRCIKKWAKTL